MLYSNFIDKHDLHLNRSGRKDLTTPPPKKTKKVKQKKEKTPHNQYKLQVFSMFFCKYFFCFLFFVSISASFELCSFLFFMCFSSSPRLFLFSFFLFLFSLFYFLFPFFCRLLFVVFQFASIFHVSLLFCFCLCFFLCVFLLKSIMLVSQN